MGEGARKKVEREYSMSSVVTEYERLYDEPHTADAGHGI